MTDDEPGCMNGYCDITGRREGVHTNGGCNCLRDLHHDVRRPVRIELARLRNRVESLEAALVADEPRDQLRMANDALDRLRSNIDTIEAQLIEQRRLLACERESSAIVAAGFKQAFAQRDRLAAELLDEQGAHAKTADNFAVFACSISDGDDTTEGPS